MPLAQELFTSDFTNNQKGLLGVAQVTMRLAVALPLLLAPTACSAFTVSSKGCPRTVARRMSTVVEMPQVEESGAVQEQAEDADLSSAAPVFDLEQYKAKYLAEIGLLQEKDAQSKSISKEDLKVLFEDHHLVAVDKPFGVLCVPGRNSDNPSLNKAVFEAFGCESERMDKMVVHRLPMDSSGVALFARSQDALREMNGLFRRKKITRQYEALLCGHLEDDDGIVDLPLMRDYEHPPYMRVSTDAYQWALVDVDLDDLDDIGDRKLLEGPKKCQTKFTVVSREELGGHPVTRVILTSITGRTHQFNVHCAALGHPIVGDKIYGANGSAAPNGGLDDETMDARAPKRTSSELQQLIADAAEAENKGVCIHAKTMCFEHPITREDLTLESLVPF